MRKWMLLTFSLLFSSLLVLSVACGDGEEEVGTTPATGAAPTLEITSPEDASTVAAGNVQVTVDASNFKVVNKLGEAPADGEGHVHFYIFEGDVADIPTTPGQPAVTAEGTYHAEATTSYTWPDVDPGEHTFAVQLVNNDHTPLEPPATAKVTVTVQ